MMPGRSGEGSAQAAGDMPKIYKVRDRLDGVLSSRARLEGKRKTT